MKRAWLMGALFFLVTARPVPATEQAPPAPPARAKCPVCGMFVAKYPDWTGSIRFKDATTAYLQYLRLSDFDSKLAGKMNYYVLGYLVGFGRKKRAAQRDGDEQLGTLAVPAGNQWVELEDGIQIQFVAGQYRAGDYWLIPARTAEVSPEDSPGAP